MCEIYYVLTIFCVFHSFPYGVKGSPHLSYNAFKGRGKQLYPQWNREVLWILITFLLYIKAMFLLNDLVTI